MYCGQCGEKNEEGAKFCQKCGLPLEQGEVVGQVQGGSHKEAAGSGRTEEAFGRKDAEGMTSDQGSASQEKGNGGTDAPAASGSGGAEFTERVWKDHTGHTEAPETKPAGRKRRVAVFAVLGAVAVTVAVIGVCAGILIHEKTQDKKQTEQTDKQASVTCTIEQNGVAIGMVLDAEGDQVVKLTQTTVAPLEGLDEATLEVLEETLKQLEEIYAAYDSVKYSYSQNGMKLREVVEIDLRDEDEIKALSDAGLLPLEWDADTISLKKSKEALEEAGWTVK